jgi:hypothetical protein
METGLSKLEFNAVPTKFYSYFVPVVLTVQNFGFCALHFAHTSAKLLVGYIDEEVSKPILRLPQIDTQFRLPFDK